MSAKHGQFHMSHTVMFTFFSILVSEYCFIDLDSNEFLHLFELLLNFSHLLLQRIIFEMERMASRPFSIVSMEIGNNNTLVALKKEPPDYRASRRKVKVAFLSPRFRAVQLFSQTPPQRPPPLS